MNPKLLRHSAQPVTLTVANGEIMEGGVDKAETRLELVRHEPLLRQYLGHWH